MSWIINNALGRRIITFLLAQIITGAVLGLNAMLPAGFQFPHDTLNVFIEAIESLAGLVIFGQTVTTVTNGSPGSPKPTVTTTTAINGTVTKTVQAANPVDCNVIPNAGAPSTMQ